MTRAPAPRHVPRGAADDSPTYSSGRGNGAAAALLGDVEGEAERRAALYAELNPKSNEAIAAMRNGDRELAAKLFVELADAWRAAGFYEEARSCHALADQARTPPKKLTRRGR